MSIPVKIFLSIILFFSIPYSTYAQAEVDPPGYIDQKGVEIEIDSTSKLLIRNIKVTGNNKTKHYIIRREIHFKIGDSIISGTLYNQMEQARRQVYNTTLFSSVVITIDFISGSEIELHVTVKEKWYIYPTPQFQLVDRNFNEWLNDYNADLERVVYGVKFDHFNLSGRRDQLRIFLLNGYARNISFNYFAPYSNRALTEGFGISGGYTQNRELAYKTSFNNKLVNHRNEGFVRSLFYGGGSYLIRRGYFIRHIISLSYSHINVDDTVTQFLNPAYFNSPKSSVGFPDLSYIYQYANTNNINYPLTGAVATLGISKRGTGFKGGINAITLDANLQKYVTHKRNWFSSFQVTTKTRLPFEQAFINQRSMGFLDNYMRGLEYYVIDGVASFMGKYTLRKKLLSINIKSPVFKKVVPDIPFHFYGKTYGDIGYNYNRPQFATYFNNRFLYSGGFGLDILSLWDVRFSLEYSFNQLGENGLFLHSKGGF